MRTAIEIIDCASGAPVQAELFDEVTVEHFLETQKEWRPIVLEAAKRLVAGRAPRETIPRHFHWDWRTKEADLRMLGVYVLWGRVRWKAARSDEAGEYRASWKGCCAERKATLVC